MTILLHTSKSMRQPVSHDSSTLTPVLIEKSVQLASFLRNCSISSLQKVMNISEPLAIKVHAMIVRWTQEQNSQIPAVDAFIGDVYSGLRAHEWSKRVRSRADERLRILSGLYGILRPNDGVFPYRLEMGYKLQPKPYTSLYQFWGDNIAKQLPEDDTLINLAPVEYSKVILPYINESRVITPSFLTTNPKSGKPVFVAVHAKIARGAFARWLLVDNITDINMLTKFNDLGYTYRADLSTPQVPVYVCEQFGGLGLSIRLM